MPSLATPDYLGITITQRTQVVFLPGNPKISYQPDEPLVLSYINSAFVYDPKAAGNRSHLLTKSEEPFIWNGSMKSLLKELKITQIPKILHDGQVLQFVFPAGEAIQIPNLKPVPPSKDIPASTQIKK